MNSVQPYAATVPYMGTVGNHEAYGTQGGGQFANYAARQRALAKYAGANSGSNSSFWYSFDTPLVHWIAFSGESWTMSAGQMAAQAAWVAADLAKVDRAVTPWVFAFSHKAYMMDSTTWGMYDWMVNGQVDVQFSGHWCAHARTPLRAPRAPTRRLRLTAPPAQTGTSTRGTRPSTAAMARSSSTPRPCRPTRRCTRTQSTPRSS